MNRLRSVPKESLGIILSVGIGLAAVILREVSRSPLFDPFFLSLALGIFIKFFMKPKDEFLLGIKKAPSLFIPIGVLLYGALNLNFQKIVSVKIDFIFLTLLVFIVFVLTSLTLSMLLGLKEKTGHLLTAGSSICGVSAIAITSQAIDADSDDISISLIAVFASALFGLFILLPLVNFFLRLSDTNYAVLSGSVLQITGFVKVAVRNLSLDAQTIASSVKTVRYLGLLFLVPVFGSLIKGKVHIPWFLWGFLVAGLFFSCFQQMAVILEPVLKPVLNVLWSVAMAAIGLNTNPNVIFSEKGIKAFVVSFVSLVVGVVIFVFGLFLGI